MMYILLAIFMCYALSTCYCGVIPETAAQSSEYEYPDEAGNDNATDDDIGHYFTDEWRSRYSESSLAQQPKWRLASNQPTKGAYQVREYVRAQWADTTTCVNERNANDFRRRVYERQVVGGNSEMEVPLLFPLLVRVEKKAPVIPSFGPKKQDFIDCRYSFKFHFPLVGARANFDWGVEYKRISTFFVLTYRGNYTVSHCNEKAEAFSELLDSQKAEYKSLVWFCAQNELGRGKRRPVYEVWFEKALNK